MNVFIGTSGYNYRHWRNGVFYPKDVSVKKELEYYSQFFKTVEINATFYGSFKKSVFENWFNKTPDDFNFTLKGSRFITHVKRIKDVEKELLKFYDSAAGLGNKLAVVLWQFPGNFKFSNENIERFEIFLKLHPKTIRQAIEFRHESWFKSSFFNMLKKHGTGFVINSSGTIPQVEVVTSDFSYIRFHGPGSLYSSCYSNKELEMWAKKITEYKINECYCYFNNDVGGFAIKNALYLKKLLRA